MHLNIHCVFYYLRWNKLITGQRDCLHIRLAHRIALCHQSGKSKGLLCACAFFHFGVKEVKTYAKHDTSAFYN